MAFDDATTAKRASMMALIATCLLLLGTACTSANPALIATAPGDPVAGIVFVSTRHTERNIVDLHQNWELYLVQPDGSELVRLTHNEQVDTSPSWSPDGRQIAYRSRAEGSSDIFVMNADGSGRPRNLVRDAADSIHDEFFPEWNPQRDLLAIYTDRFYSPAVGCAWHRVALLPLSGGKDNIQVLKHFLTEQETLAWAPDGRTLTFSSRCNMANERAVELFNWDIDNDEITQLTDDGYINAAPAYSHDGRFLAYQSFRDQEAVSSDNAATRGNADIMVLELATGVVTNLTNHPAKDAHPTWSPDDGRIAFVSNRDGNDEIYVMNADGSDPRNITNHPDRDFEPAWSPVEDG